MNGTAFQAMTVLARNPAVKVSRLGTKAIAHDRSSGQVHVLTGSAARLLELLDGEATVGKVTASFGDSYGIPAEAVSGDVEEILQTFHELALVRATGEPV